MGRVEVPALPLMLLAGALAVSAVGLAAPSEPVVEILEPGQGATVEGVVEIRGAASVEDGDVDRVEVRIDDGAWQQAEGTTDWTFGWNTTRVDDGGHTILARAFNGDAASDLTTRDVTVANAEPNSPPRVAFDRPDVGAIVNGTVVVAGSATDPDGDLARVEIRVDGGPWVEARGTEQWGVPWDTTGYDDGVRVLEARAVDSEGPGPIVARPVEVRNAEPLEPAAANQPPVLDLASPENGTEVANRLMIEGAAQDPDDAGGILLVEARIDNGDWAGTAVRSGDTFAFERNTTALSPGDHLLTVRVTDGANGTQEEQRSFVRAAATGPEPAPEAAEPGPSPLTVGAGLFVVLLVLGAAGLWMWSRQ